MIRISQNVRNWKLNFSFSHWVQLFKFVLQTAGSNLANQRKESWYCRFCRKHFECYSNWGRGPKNIKKISWHLGERGVACEQPGNVNFEPIIIGLKNDIFYWDQVYNSFRIYVRFNCNRKKLGKIVSGRKVPLKGGLRRPMAWKKIHNFWTPSLSGSKSVG